MNQNGNPANPTHRPRRQGLAPPDPTMIALLPPPIQDTPEATETRNRAAIASIAAPAPVNANQAESAAECVLTRAQAEHMMRLIRVHDDDIKLVIRLNAQCLATVKLSPAANNRLIRDRQQRQSCRFAAKTGQQTGCHFNLAPGGVISILR